MGGRDEVVAGGAGGDRHALDRRPAASQDERRPADGRLDAAGELVEVEGRQRAAEADGAERALGRRADRRRELRVVPERGVRVQREVVRDERGVRGEEHLEAAAEAGVDDERLVAPEEAVVDEHELRAERRGALEELAGGRDTPQAMVVTSSAPTTWRPGGANSGKRSTSSNAFAWATISSRRATARVYGSESLPFRGSGCGAAW